MEIKTSEEIIYTFGYCTSCASKYSLISERNARDKKWVVVDDILKILNDDSITCFQDLIDNLKEELQQSHEK